MAVTVFDFIIEQCKATLGGEPPPPKVVADASNTLNNLSNFTANDPKDLSSWLKQWKQLFHDPLPETLLVRILQLHLPRIAEALTLLGIIEFKFQDLPGTQLDAFKIHWSADDASRSSVMQFLDPAKSKDPITWLSFLASRLGDDVESAKTNWDLLKTLIGLLIVSPNELVRLEYARQGFTSLPRQLDSPPINLDLNKLIGLINSPLQIPLTDRMRRPDQQSDPAYPALGELFDLFNLQPADNKLIIDGPDSLLGQGLDRLTGLSIALDVKDPQTFFGSVDFMIADGWSIGVRTHDTGRNIYGIKVGPGGKLQVTGVINPVVVEMQRVSHSSLVLGASNGSRVSLGRVLLRLTLTRQPSRPPLALELAVDPVEVVLDATTLAGALVGSVGLPDIKFQCNFNPTIDVLHGWNSQSAGLSFDRTIHLDLNLGLLQIPDVKLGLAIKPLAGSIQATMTATLTAMASLGPVSATLTGVGVSVSWSSDVPPEHNPLSITGKPPTGIGLAIKAPPIEGGGSIAKLGEKEYGGTFGLKLLGIGISAYGIYKELESKDPSFIAIIGFRFPTPGVQLSWGFALSGVGGLIGVNRRANTELLRERLSSGAAGNVLFNENPAANAPSLLNDLRDFFPDEKGVFVVGPTLQITWGVTLISVDLGVFIELPGPRQIFVAGSLRIMIGADPTLAVVFLRMDFVGGIDFTSSLIYFDAALVNSHVLQVFRLTGGAAVRINFGADGFFLLTIGGYHPSFHPGNLQLPQVARVGAYLSVDVGVRYWLRMEGYFAITPNTLQMGAKMEAGLSIGPLDAHGWLGFDALVQFKPFHFEARIDAGFDVSCEGVSFCGVQIVGLLSGPGPLVIQARASVKILFVRVSGEVTIKMGSDSEDRIVPIDDLLDQVSNRLKSKENYSVRSQGEDPHVILKPAPGLNLISPLGQLVWDQRIIPLGRDLSRFEGVPLTSRSFLSLSVKDRDVTPEYNTFSAGTYAEMSQSDALNTSRFAKEQSGVRIGSPSATLAPSHEYPPSMNLILISGDQRKVFEELELSIFSWREGLAQFRSERHGYMAASALADGPVEQGKFPRPKFLSDRWHVQSTNSLAGDLGGEVSSIQAWSAANRLGGLACHATDKDVDLSRVLNG